MDVLINICGYLAALCCAFAAPFLCFVWMLMLTMPFIGFTFTDPGDFVFVTLIPLTLLGIAWQHFHRPNSEAAIRVAARLAYILAVVGPLVPLAALYLASWRASGVLGHWPQCMVDDPKIICHGDARYESCLSAFTYACAFGGWSITTFTALLLHLRRQIPTKRLLCMMAVFMAAWIAFMVEPGGRFAWWLD